MTIDEVLKKAFESGDLEAGGLLLPEQAAAFVRKIIDSAVITKESRRIPMTAKKRWIEKIGFAERVMQAAVESTEPGATSKPTTGKVELSVAEALAAVDISYSTLEDNIERANLQQTVLDLVAERISLDLEELYLYGDKAAGADDYLKLIDGWLLRADAHVVDAAQAEISKDIFHSALKLLPKKYLRNKKEWRFYVSHDVELDYRTTLAEKATAAGDRYLLEDVPVFYSGIPIMGVGAVKTEVLDAGPPEILGSQAMLAHPKNLIVGFHRDITNELERKPRKRVIEATTTVRTDCQIEENDAIVKIINIKHSA